MLQSISRLLEADWTGMSTETCLSRFAVSKCYQDFRILTAPIKSQSGQSMREMFISQ